MKWLVGTVCAGASVIAAIGFTGSYWAVQKLAERKGFGTFAYALPVGIDAGIVVLLALDLLLTWLRIPFPLLRQTAWLLTAATIAFNGAAAWPDPVGVGMHAVIPLLFVVTVEAARHAIGRVSDITADRHMEGVRVSRWLLAFPSTFRLWRRMKLWELRSYEEVIRLEQHRVMYEAMLRHRFGRRWRRKAPVEALMPLRLARYGVRLTETAPAGLTVAGIDPGPWNTSTRGTVSSTAAAEQLPGIDEPGLGIATTPPAAALMAAEQTPAPETRPGPVDLPWPVLRTRSDCAITHPDPAQDCAQIGARQGAQESAQHDAQGEPADDAQQGAQHDAQDSVGKATKPQPNLRSRPKPKQARKGAQDNAQQGAQKGRRAVRNPARRTAAQQAELDAQIHAARHAENPPSLRVLAAQFGVSDGTVRNAIDRHEARISGEQRAGLRVAGGQ